MSAKPERRAVCTKAGLVAARYCSMSLNCPSLTSSAALVPFSIALSSEPIASCKREPAGDVNGEEEGPAPTQSGAPGPTAWSARPDRIWNRAASKRRRAGV